MITTFLGYKLYGNNLAQSEKRTAAEPVVSKAEQYYNANIGKVKTASDLVNNFRLLSYATQAFGLSDMTYAKSLLTKVLESNLSDPKSVANELHDSRYTAFAAAFSFSSTGKLAAPLQSSSQQSVTESLFQAKTTLDPTAAAAATSSYESAMKSTTTLSQLEKNPAALGYVLIAYGIDPAAAASTFEQTLQSDLSDPASFLNTQQDGGYLALSEAFNVGPDGTASSKIIAQTADATTAMTNTYMSLAASGSAAQHAAATETSYFTAQIKGITSVSALLSDSRLSDYIKKAFGLPSTATADTITQALSSNLADKTSFANTSPFTSYLTMAKAFNFTTAGVAGSLQFQSASQRTSTVQLYMARQTTDSAAAATATAYYNANIGKVQSVSDLQNDPKLLNYVLTAYGVNANTPASTVASVLQQTKSIDTGFYALSQAFKVNSDGTDATAVVAQKDDDTTAAVTAYMKASGSDSASQKAATTETNYFLSKISGVQSVGDLTGDSRLVAYLKQAYGLPPTATAADIGNALTSDTTNASSFARSSGVPAYLTLAQSFNFLPSGAAGTLTQIQSNAQQTTTEQLYLERSGASTKAATETSYYQTHIGSVHSVSDLQSDARLLDYVLSAYDVDEATPAATVASILQNTGNVVDPYRGMAQDFNIKPDGSAAGTLEAQTAANTTATTNAYMIKAGSDAAAQTAATAETAYYTSRIGQVTSIKDMLGDSRLMAYITKAYGLPSGVSASRITQALTSDLSNNQSFAQLAGPAYLALAKAFDFTTAGAPLTDRQFQSSAQQQSTVQRFAAAASDLDPAVVTAATAYYNANIGAVQSLGDLESDPKLLTFVETAYGISPSTTAAGLSSLFETTHSVTDTTANTSLLALKLAFNADSAGNAVPLLAAQSSANVSATTAAYASNAKTDTASQTAAAAATAYYKSTIGSVTSVSGLLADAKLVAYVKQAYGLPAATSNDVLTKVLTSDLTSAKSLANTMGGGYEKLAAAFDFTKTGLLASVPQEAQSKAQRDAMNTAYVQQQMETEAGSQNPGIKLALYMQINASRITDAYSVLADKQLTKVFQTVLGLPATASNADIDAQAKTITNQINLKDLKDPKKLDAFIERFSILYDLNPPASTAPLTGLSLLSSSTDPLDVTTLFSGSS